MNSKLLAYSLDFTSFIIQKTRNLNDIRNIILFGSVARGEESSDSDIDIFIDFIGKKKNEKEFNKLLDDFIDSSKYKNYWCLLGIDNEINLSIGNLNKWKELEASIASNGITLYGKFKSIIKGGEHKTFFIWENVKPNSKRVMFNKKLFGYKQNNTFYEGLLKKYKGERLGKGIVVVPLEHGKFFKDLFRDYKITFKTKNVMEY